MNYFSFTIVLLINFGVRLQPHILHHIHCFFRVDGGRELNKSAASCFSDGGLMKDRPSVLKEYYSMNDELSYYPQSD